MSKRGSSLIAEWLVSGVVLALCYVMVFLTLRDAGATVIVLGFVGLTILIGLAFASPKSKRRRSGQALSAAMLARTKDWEPGVPVPSADGKTEQTLITFTGVFDPPQPSLTSFLLVLEGTVRSDFDGKHDVAFGPGEMVVVLPHAAKPAYAKIESKVLVSVTLDPDPPAET